MDALMEYDPYLLFADYQSYIDCQDRSARRTWTGQMGEDGAFKYHRMGKFSSDRAIREYCRGIWHAESIKISQE